VDMLLADGLVPECIEIAIAPGQRAARGVATLKAVFSYLGQPVRVWENGRWVKRYGWMDLRRITLAFATRWGALCDVPDLELLPERYAAAKTVRFHAALELSIQHSVLWSLAAVIRLGIPLPVARWCAPLDRLASRMDRFGGQWGGMRVSVLGAKNGQRLRRSWLLTVPAMDGPEIPCMPAISLLRKLASGEVLAPGARACVGLLSLEDFRSQFGRHKIQTRIQEDSR
jgi:hypothetical protein